MITKAVGFVGNVRPAGVGYLQLSTQYRFNDQVLHLSHQHWNTQKGRDDFLAQDSYVVS